MSVPGSNLLAQALTALGQQAVVYRRCTSRTTDAAGRQVSVYATPVTVYGSFQAVNTDLLTSYGLDMNKQYATFFASAQFNEPNRDQSPDAFDYGGRRWIAVTSVDWYAQDGWNSVLVVDSGPAPT